jgi:hypothetical protein
MAAHNPAAAAQAGRSAAATHGAAARVEGMRGCIHQTPHASADCVQA